MVGFVTEPQVDLVIEPLLVVLTGQDVWVDLEIHLLVEMVTGFLDIPETVFALEEVGGTED